MSTSAGAPLRLLLVDNYDSFSFNLLQLFAARGAEVELARSDRLTLSDLDGEAWDGFILGPGPGRPEDAGVSLELVRARAGRTPLLGVCLGHQVIAQAHGARILRDTRPWHGKLATIHHAGSALLSGLPSPFGAVRYNSLLVTGPGAPLEAVAWDERGAIMAVERPGEACFGVQFHPESALSEHGAALADRFLEVCRSWRRAPRVGGD